MSNPKQQEILDLAKARRTLSISELADALGVSTETIRRQIKPLVAQGLLSKTHGAVQLPSQVQEPAFQRRMRDQPAAKQHIAQRFAAEVQDGDTLILDSGSTNVFVAEALRHKQGLVVITNSTEIAKVFNDGSRNRVYLAGGEYRPDDGAAFGDATIQFMRQFHVRYGVITIGAISAEGEFAVFQPYEADLARVVMSRAERSVVVADHSKFARSALAKVCDADRVDMLICDEAPPAGLAAMLAEAGTAVIW